MDFSPDSPFEETWIDDGLLEDVCLPAASGFLPASPPGVERSSPLHAVRAPATPATVDADPARERRSLAEIYFDDVATCSNPRTRRRNRELEKQLVAARAELREALLHLARSGQTETVESLYELEQWLAEEAVFPERIVSRLLGQRRGGPSLPWKQLDSLPTTVTVALEHLHGIKTQLIESHLRLVVFLSKAYRDQGVPLEDLIQEGNLGLMQAVDHFDPQRGFRFSSYASWRIRQRMIEALDRHAGIVRFTHRWHVQRRQTRKAIRHLEQHLGRPPTTEEVARWFDRDERWVQERLLPFDQDHSLDGSRANADDGPSLYQVLPDDRSPDPSEPLEREERRSSVRECLRDLPDRERRLLEARFGFHGSPRTLRDLGEEMGLSHEGVRQVEKRALARVRPVLEQRLEPAHASS